jgi:hypothetical protein
MKDGVPDGAGRSEQGEKERERERKREKENLPRFAVAVVGRNTLSNVVSGVLLCERRLNAKIWEDDDLGG